MWDDDQTYHPIAIADLHGELTLLQRLLREIPTVGTRLIFLGDYLDRGEDSFGTIHFLASLAQERDCLFLRGNHDAAWLESWTGERFARCPAIPGAQSLWSSVQGQVPSEIVRFLERTQVDWEDTYAYYAHAGAEPGTPFRRTPAEVKIWGDSRFLTASYDWGKPVIFGHYELPKPLITPTKIGIDTAAYRTGILTAFDVVERNVIQKTR
jgi:serine/threonine protein phosphatase 1